MSEAIQKNVGTIALVVAIIALVSSLVPQIKDLSSNPGGVVPAPAQGQGGAPGGMGPGGPGGRPGGMGPGGPGMGPGMMFGSAPSKETIDKFAERLKLYDEALKTAQGDDLLKMRVERDAAKLMTLRIENGARRIAPGISDCSKCARCLPARRLPHLRRIRLSSTIISSWTACAATKRLSSAQQRHSRTFQRHRHPTVIWRIFWPLNNSVRSLSIKLCSS